MAFDHFQKILTSYRRRSLFVCLLSSRPFFSSFRFTTSSCIHPPTHPHTNALSHPDLSSVSLAPYTTTSTLGPLSHGRAVYCIGRFPALPVALNSARHVHRTTTSKFHPHTLNRHTSPVHRPCHRYVLRAVKLCSFYTAARAETLYHGLRWLTSCAVTTQTFSTWRQRRRGRQRS